MLIDPIADLSAHFRVSDIEIRQRLPVVRVQDGHTPRLVGVDSTAPAPLPGDAGLRALRSRVVLRRASPG